MAKKTLASILKKTLVNVDAKSAKKNVPDMVVEGNPDAWRVICKASSKKEGWMKVTKAMFILGYGCLVQTSTQQDGQVSDALEFIPGVKIGRDNKGNRILEKF